MTSETGLTRRLSWRLEAIKIYITVSLVTDSVISSANKEEIAAIFGLL